MLRAIPWSFAIASRSRMMQRDGRTSQKLRPECGRTEMVSTLAGESRFRSKSAIFEAGVFDRDAAAEHHRRAHARACSEQHDSGHSRASRADAGFRSSLVTGNGSCGSRDANRGGEISPQDREKNAPRSRSRRFLRRVLEWQDKHGGIIIEQLKRLGCSCDWSRQRYTLDDAYAAPSKKFLSIFTTRA